MWNVWAANVLKWTFVFLHVLLPGVKHQLPGFSWILLIAALHVVEHIKRMAWLSSVHISTTVKCVFMLYTNVLLCFPNVSGNVNVCNDFFIGASLYICSKVIIMGGTKFGIQFFLYSYSLYSLIPIPPLALFRKSIHIVSIVTGKYFFFPLNRFLHSCINITSCQISIKKTNSDYFLSCPLL